MEAEQDSFRITAAWEHHWPETVVMNVQLLGWLAQALLRRR